MEFSDKTIILSNSFFQVFYSCGVARKAVGPTSFQVTSAVVDEDILVAEGF